MVNKLIPHSLLGTHKNYTASLQVLVCVTMFGLLQQHIVTLALQEGRRFLCEGQPRLAIPAALEALKILTEIHGGTHTMLTPAYLIMAEAAIGMRVPKSSWLSIQAMLCRSWTY